MVEPVGGEDVLEIPQSWRKVLVPRRGGAAGAVLKPSASAAQKLLEPQLTGIEQAWQERTSDPELVAAGRRWLADPATGPALGAAVVATTTAPIHGWSYVERYSAFGDSWAARGFDFAIEALAEMTTISASAKSSAMPNAVHRVIASPGYFPHWWNIAARVRAHLAAASDDDYAAAVKQLTGLRDGELRGGGELRQALPSFLVPDQLEWAEEDCERFGGARDLCVMMWCTAATVPQLEKIANAVGFWQMCELGYLVTAIDGAGTGVAPLYATMLDEYQYAAKDQLLLSVISAIPTDQAFGLLLDRLDRKYVQGSVLEAAKRFPGRAMRLLPGAAADTGPRSRLAHELLRGHALAYPEIAEAVAAELPEASRQALASIAAAAVSVPAATAADLPELLVSPPWTKARPAAAKPVVVTGLTAQVTPAVVWRPGERQEWTESGREYNHHRGTWEELAEKFGSNRLSYWEAHSFVANGPEELVRPLLAGWAPQDSWDCETWGRALAGRFELDALPPLLKLAAASPAAALPLLLPYAAVEAAVVMADGYHRLKSGRKVALSWLDRHPEVAARALIPQALGKAGAARNAAEATLRALITAGHGDVVRAVAAGYGIQAAQGVEQVAAADPLLLLPAKMPVLPDWADAGLLPPPLLKGRTLALPLESARHVVMMLALSKPGEVYAGLGVVKEHCDADSLADFSWALFQRWQALGAPPKVGWVLDALRWLGNDETVRQLSPIIRAWPGEGGHAKAVTGLDILADIGSDVALMHLHRIAQRVKFKGLKERANDKMAEVAAALGLTAEQLADRLVPDLGLDASGSMTLDYGSRRFVVGFDEQLKPYVADEDGLRRKELPKPGAKDDPELAPAAYQRFSGLKKDVRTLASDQITRLEVAMVTQRRWTASEFQTLFVNHPLLWHIVRRLVWAAFTDKGEVAAAFRVAEDRTLADVGDDAYTLPEEATVGIAHPLHLGGDLPGWGEVFADYEILQPFAQLGRSVHALTPQEAGSADLERFCHIKMPTGKVVGMERRGWRRGSPQDGGVQGWMYRTVGSRSVVADLNPGIPVGMINEMPEQEFEHVWISNQSDGDWFHRNRKAEFGTLDAITASEVLRDLIEVTGL